MTKKEYCKANVAKADHVYYNMSLHGIEYGIDDYAYISRVYQPVYCGNKEVSYHRLKVRCNRDNRAYVILKEKLYNGKYSRIYLYIEDFIRANCPWCRD
jgi:hypothetical protein